MMVPKFRAWDEINALMIADFGRKTEQTSQGRVSYGIKITNGNEVKATASVQEPENMIYLHSHDLILMQYTGVKDKNGVEIFEGDVVRYTWDMLSDVNATEKGKKVRVSKVFWSDWRASWAVGKKSCNNDLFRYARNGNTVEVIGNIYEQPELLGGNRVREEENEQPT